LGKIILGMVKPDSGRVALETDKLQVVFQDPFNSLDPRMRVSDILAEGLMIKDRAAKSCRAGLNLPYHLCRTDEINGKVEEILDLIKLPKEALKKYPHQFSGGERQRIAIGRAIITDPEFIVFDEPVSSLDVTIQLQKKLKLTCLFISHDLKVIKFICDKVAVMSRGKIVESGYVRDIYASAVHPYTRSLLKAAFYDSMKNDGREDL
jgi:ABC-type microcin C transport system duplicated ATPase subunit YejF